MEEQPETAQSINSLAYSVKQDIVFGPDQYNPKTKEGQRLLAHELAHVVQQRQSPLTGGQTGTLSIQRQPRPKQPLFPLSRPRSCIKIQTYPMSRIRSTIRIYFHSSLPSTSSTYMLKTAYREGSKSYSPPSGFKERVRKRSKRKSQSAFGRLS